MSRGAIVVPVFILIALSILFFTHYFVYLSLTHFFGIAAPAWRTALAVTLFLLPATFIASSILAHRVDNVLSRTLYFCSSLWLGVGLTLLAACVVAWAAWGASRLVTHSPSPAWYGLAALVFTGIYSAYGIWNAYHPRVERITVHLKNLPPAWRGKKVVQLSDVHLGRVLGTRFLDGLVEKVNAEDPAGVFITGDLFDGTDGHLDELVSPLNNLNAPAFFITGNHETFLGVERAYAALHTTRVRILADEMVTVDGLQVIGISYPTRGHPVNFAKLLAQLPGFDPALPSILLYHSPTHREEAKAAGISLQLAGHVHRGQIFPIQLFTRLIYGKYYYGLHVDGDYALYTTSGAGTWGATMRTGNHPEFVVIHLE